MSVLEWAEVVAVCVVVSFVSGFVFGFIDDAIHGWRR